MDRIVYYNSGRWGKPYPECGHRHVIVSNAKSTKGKRLIRMKQVTTSPVMTTCKACKRTIAYRRASHASL